MTKLFVLLMVSLGTSYASAMPKCIPYDPVKDAKTPGIKLYCRGYACVNAGPSNDMPGVKLLNQSSLHGFYPPAGKNSQQICENVHLSAEDQPYDSAEESSELSSDQYIQPEQYIETSQPVQYGE